jgi:hypothetical protein
VQALQGVTATGTSTGLRVLVPVLVLRTGLRVSQSRRHTTAHNRHVYCNNSPHTSVSSQPSVYIPSQPSRAPQPSRRLQLNHPGHLNRLVHHNRRPPIGLPISIALRVRRLSV